MLLGPQLSLVPVSQDTVSRRERDPWIRVGRSAPAIDLDDHRKRTIDYFKPIY